MKEWHKLFPQLNPICESSRDKILPNIYTFYNERLIKGWKAIIVHTIRSLQLEEEEENQLKLILPYFPTVRAKDWETQFMNFNSSAYPVKLLKIAANAIDANGNPVLSVACEAGSLISVKKLIDYGADVNAVDKCEKTPMHWALSSKILSGNLSPYSNIPIMCCLLKYGVKVNEKSYDNLTITQYAYNRDCTMAISFFEHLITSSIAILLETYLPRDMSIKVSSYFNCDEIIKSVSPLNKSFRQLLEPQHYVKVIAHMQLI